MCIVKIFIYLYFNMGKEKNNTSNYANEPYLILAMDLAVSLLSSLFAILIVRWLAKPIPHFITLVLIWLALSAVFSIIGFLAVGSQKVSLVYSTIRTTGKLAAAVLIKETLLILSIITGLFVMTSVKARFLIILLDCIFSIAGMTLIRAMVVSIMVRNRNSIEFNVDRMSILIYGISDKSTALVQRLFSSSHYNPIGFITTDSKFNGRIIHDRKAYSCTSLDEFQTVCSSLGGVDGIIFAKETDAKEQSDKIVAWCLASQVNILMSPQVEVIHTPKPANNTPGTAETVYSNAKDPGFIPDGMSGFERNVKRAIDFFVSAILLVIFSPAFLACYIAIKREDHGPAIFKQERIGRFGRPFYIYKFRSMKLDAEAAGPALYSGDEDPRLTKVGKFIRTHHLDELPQLYNVLRGDMAFIGYRPERQFYIDQIIEKDPRYVYLYQIRPGVTSYATLKNGYTDSIEKMLRRLQFDLYYLKNRSWWFDFKILLQTFLNIAFGKKF